MKFFNVIERTNGKEHIVEIQYDLKELRNTTTFVVSENFERSFKRLAEKYLMEFQSKYYPNAYVSSTKEHGSLFKGNNRACMEKIANALNDFNMMADDIYEKEMNNSAWMEVEDFNKVLPKYFDYVMLKVSLPDNSSINKKKVKI